MNIKKLITFSAAIAAFSTMSAPALAEGDLVFMHNASPYQVWTDLKACQNDVKKSGHKCGFFSSGRSNNCDSTFLYSFEMPNNIARDRWERKEDVVLYANDGSNRKVCTYMH
ncbi:MAG: hypothetical protein P8P30_01905 [Rickettsiales bacterium]|nr:hypothetical protein [Rickettsiales bacterium]